MHVQLWVTMPDADAAHDRAVAAGATSVAPVAEQQDDDRAGGFIDPFGTLWWVSSAA